MELKPKGVRERPTESTEEVNGSATAKVGSLSRPRRDRILGALSLLMLIVGVLLLLVYAGRHPQSCSDVSREQYIVTSPTGGFFYCR
ncbi:hypothetical protein [Pseudofrankia inefficax]|uniref:Uncharacterized protein n=1 Tax=Pseudofrankia inefficax (strain DSM 45817 / CECT 9037 / DDB 130130 / EuI1c) TaxID=298654 RepID=E3J5C6_PSEI1|nr:hypothetical protein [Pseudofrankia inefficax]ADP81870.1 hypothetical protein FraEuI1c_3863 [Pseudofrankia inefficax]